MEKLARRGLLELHLGMEQSGEHRAVGRLQASQRTGQGPGAGLVGDRQREAAQMDERDAGEGQ